MALESIVAFLSFYRVKCYKNTTFSYKTITRCL